MEKKKLQQVLDALQACADNCENPMDTRDALNVLQAALDAPNEPVEYQMNILGNRWTHCSKVVYDAAPNRNDVRALYAHLAPKQTPLTENDLKVAFDSTPSYPAILKDTQSFHWFQAGAKAAEGAHKHGIGVQE